MSLRAEIHDAIDEVTPPAPHLPKEVELHVLANERHRVVLLQPSRWTAPFRGTLSLVAAALVVALIGGLILGGRIWQDLHTQQPSINQAALRSLETRSLRPFPTVVSGEACPTSPLSDVSAHGPDALMLGQGPVYANHLDYSYGGTTNWGAWSKLLLKVDTKASGLILIRARDLQTNAMVVFATVPLHAGNAAGDGVPTGRVQGNDVVTGQHEQEYSEDVLDLSRPYEGTVKGDWPIYAAFLGDPRGGSGCVGLQLDGMDFTELLVVN